MSAKASIKSFQDCTETDVPGYNDCPSVLYQVNKAAAKKGRRNRIVTQVRDVSGNTTSSSLPPPAVPSRVKETYQEELSNTLTNEEVLKRIEAMYELSTSLSSKEFEFYKKKIDLNVAKSLSSESTRHMLTAFFEQWGDKSKCTNMLREWLASDITISSWCPAFLKIYENATIV